MTDADPERTRDADGDGAENHDAEDATDAEKATETTTADAENATEMTTDTETETETDASAGPSARSLLRVARWVGIGIASLLALVAAVNLYTTVGRLIGVWVSARYQPLFRAGFDVVVLLVAAAVVVRLARESDAFS